MVKPQTHSTSKIAVSGGEYFLEVSYKREPTPEAPAPSKLSPNFSASCHFPQFA